MTDEKTDKLGNRLAFAATLAVGYAIAYFEVNLWIVVVVILVWWILLDALPPAEERRNG